MSFLVQFLFERRSRQLRRSLNQWREQVGLVIRNYALQDRGYSLQAHARVYRGLGQRIQFAAGVAVELHEHQVPDFYVAAAVAAEGAVGVALVGCCRAHVVVDLAAGAAGAGVAHLPEIVFQAHLEDVVFGYALGNPQIVGFGVARHSAFAIKNRHIEFALVDPKPLRRSNQLPGVGDGVFLEIVAKRKIAQHFEERMMAVGEADVFEVVVFAAGANAFLRSRGAVVVAGFEAEEDVLELVHARVGEEQRWIVGRYERG